MNRNLNKKTISISNHTASFRPFAWLALAILSCGAFGNSVHAQAWLDENFNSLGAGVNLTVGGNCVAAGTAGYATGAAGGGALRILKTTTAASSVTEARWSPCLWCVWKFSSSRCLDRRKFQLIRGWGCSNNWGQKCCGCYWLCGGSARRRGLAN